MGYVKGNSKPNLGPEADGGAELMSKEGANAQGLGAPGYIYIRNYTDIYIHISFCISVYAQRYLYI